MSKHSFPSSEGDISSVRSVYFEHLLYHYAYGKRRMFAKRLTLTVLYVDRAIHFGGLSPQVFT
jgi:hypothetical protein